MNKQKIINNNPPFEKHVRPDKRAQTEYNI